MKKCGEKEKGTVQGRTDRKRPILNPSTCILHVNFLSFVGISLTKKKWRERKMNKYKEELMTEGPFLIPQYN